MSETISTTAAFQELLNTFHELNTQRIDELHDDPSPLEFMRYVSRNTPFVIRGGASAWPCVKKWNSSYLKSALQDQIINIAVTPLGNADSPTYSPTHGETVFAKPHEESQPFDTFLDYLIRQETDATTATVPGNAEVRYAQTQNDNLRNEYNILLPDAPQDIPFARIALQKEPDAINLWIGGSRSVTALHKDNFENIYAQVSGRKHFVLLSPVCHPCINEKLLPSATYVRHDHEFRLVKDGLAGKVPFPTWDPDEPSKNTTPLSHLAQPVLVTLNPGDMLYLPTGWYHKVTQSSAAGSEGFAAAINYWYDMDFAGPFYPLTSFLRNISLARSDA